VIEIEYEEEVGRQPRGEAAERDAEASTTARGSGAEQRGLSHWFKRPRSSDASAAAASVPPPPGWEAVLATVAEQREHTAASVDEFHDFLLTLRCHPEPHFE
jgi:hypothetical protein